MEAADGNEDDDDVQRGCGRNVNRKRRQKRSLREFVAENDDDALYAEEGSNGGDGDDDVAEEKYPEVGVRATATIQVAKGVFVGHEAVHREVAREMVLEGLRHIAEYRWIHEKYAIDADAVRYLVFLDEDLKIPIEFEEVKPKRGRPPKHKKARTNADGRDMKDYNADPEHDKLYRLNFQIIFEHEVAERVRREIVQCIKIDLNQTSLAMLLSTVLAAKIDIPSRVQAYSR